MYRLGCREILRFESSLVGTNRTACCGIEVGGKTIRAGERTMTLWWRDRDPVVFEESDRFDIERQGAPAPFIIARASLVQQFPEFTIDTATAK